MRSTKQSAELTEMICQESLKGKTIDGGQTVIKKEEIRSVIEKVKLLCEEHKVSPNHIFKVIGI